MKSCAVLVHLFTASGLIPMMLAVDAIWRDQAYLALTRLGVAMMIDGLDGPLTRRFNVAVIFVLGAMTFLPVRFIQPLRIVFLRRLNAPLISIGRQRRLFILGSRLPVRALTRSRSSIFFSRL